MVDHPLVLLKVGTSKQFRLFLFDKLILLAEGLWIEWIDEKII